MQGTAAMVASGQAGQKALTVGDNLLAGLGISHLAGWTIGPVFLDILVLSGSGNTSTGVVRWYAGLIVADGSQDEGDFPNLQAGDGDYMLKGGGVYQFPGVAIATVLPSEGSIKLITSRSSRRLERIGDVPFLIFQQDNANDADYHWQITYMAIMP